MNHAAMFSPGDRLVEAVRQGLVRCGVAPTDRLVVAASGGVDSMALLHAFVEVRQPIMVATIDHGLDGGSGETAAFVLSEAARLGIEAETVAVQVEPGNVQAQARDARYAALADAARRQSCAAVATGHTATDQAETVLMSLIRGAGLRGLAGMPQRRPLADGVDLVRPMLQLSRAEVEAAARERGWPWREDASNATGVYQRNRLRHNVMTLLRREGGEGVDSRIADAAASARGALDVVANRVSGPDRVLSISTLTSLSPDAQRVLLAEAVGQWAPSATRSSALVERLRHLAGAPVGAHVDSGGVRVWRQRDGLRFDMEDPAPATGTLTVTPLDAVPGRFDLGAFTELVDLDRAGEVQVRTWREGDRIRPLGLDGSTLVSDLLRNRDVSRADRGGVPVVVRGGEILWVVGHRLAASVAITAETVRAGKWTWRPGEGSG